MPTPAEILRTLAATSREMTALAIVWHGLLAFVMIRILTGWRPSKRFGALVLALPLLSVSVLAWRYGNPFNGAVFAGFAALLLVLGLRRPAFRELPVGGVEVVLDVAADQLALRPGQDPGVAGSVRLHLDVVPVRRAVRHAEVDAGAGELRGRREAGVQPGVLLRDDALHRLVVDGQTLGPARHRL